MRTPAEVKKLVKSECPEFKHDDFEPILAWSTARIWFSTPALTKDGTKREYPEIASWGFVWPNGGITLEGIRQKDDEYIARMATAMFIHLWCKGVEVSLAIRTAEAYALRYGKPGLKKTDFFLILLGMVRRSGIVAMTNDRWAFQRAVRAAYRRCRKCGIGLQFETTAFQVLSEEVIETGFRYGILSYDLSTTDGKMRITLTKAGATDYVLHSHPHLNISAWEKIANSFVKAFNLSCKMQDRNTGTATYE